MNTEDQKDRASILMMFQFIWNRILTKKVWLFAAIGALIATAILQFLIPQIPMHIIDNVIPSKSIDRLAFFCILYVALTAILGVMDYIATYVVSRVSQGAVNELREELYRHILNQDFRFFEDQKTGDVMSRITGDINALQSLISTNTLSIFGTIVTFIWVFFYVLLREPRLLALILLTFPLLFFVSRFFNKRLKQTHRKSRETFSYINNHLQRTLTAIPLIKSFVSEPIEEAAFNELSELNTETLNTASKIQSLYGPSMSMVDVLGSVIVLGYGALAVMNQSMSVGEILAYMSYLSLLQRPMKTITSMVSRFQQALVSFERILDLLEVNPSITNKRNPQPFPDDAPTLVFDNVSYGYDASQRVVDDITFAMPHGHLVALVGSSGSGKTTVTKLLNRFMDVDDGSITVAGADIRDMDVYDLRRNIGWVSQDVILVDGTIFDNVAYGNPSATLEDVRFACSQANILSFIDSLPHGFETQVGERGIKLSGGQKQRIALARVFLKDAPIMILDEATASLDNESEREIQKAFDILIETKTSLVIAHRLSTIQNADLILVMEHGKIVEQGTHQQLLKENGRYHEIYNAQFKD